MPSVLWNNRQKSWKPDLDIKRRQRTAKRIRSGVGKPYVIKGRRYVPRHEPGYDQTGIASFYGDGCHGKPTASGEIYDRHGLTAAHPTLPLQSVVLVENLKNGRKLKLRINDRGPFVPGRIIDVSERAAKDLGFKANGLTRVRVRYTASSG